MKDEYNLYLCRFHEPGLSQFLETNHPNLLKIEQSTFFELVMMIEFLTAADYCGPWAEHYQQWSREYTGNRSVTQSMKRIIQNACDLAIPDFDDLQLFDLVIISPSDLGIRSHRYGDNFKCTTPLSFLLPTPLPV